MHFSSALQCLLAMVAMAPSVIATPVAAPASLVERSPGFMDPVAIEEPLGKRSFTASCDECKYGQSFVHINCKCRNAAGQTVSASINLDNCLANADSHAVWRRNGGISGSCSGTSMGKTVTGKFEWSYYCKGGPNGGGAGWIDLNERIHNDNGRMWCDV